jgi:DNA-binding NtrC family response regulator
MPRPRVVLLEPEAVLLSILLRFLESEDIEASACASAADLQRLITHDAARIVVAESWTSSAGAELSHESHKDIEALGGASAGLILTSGRAWAIDPRNAFSSRVIVIPKPYDLDNLADAIRVMWARAIRRGRVTAWGHVAPLKRATCPNRPARTLVRGPSTR